MKIVTWNINGIRSPCRPALKALLDSFDADVICLQETKVTREMLDEQIALVEGYNAYFSYSRKRGGYSGVVTYCKDSVRPVAAEEGISGYLTSLNGKPDLDTAVGHYGSLCDLPVSELKELDAEGRTVITELRLLEPDGRENSVCIFNVYCPRADPDREDRKAFKLRFCELLQIRCEALLAQGKHVIVVGDLNTSHRPIDTCDSSRPGWGTSPPRIWLDNFLWIAGRDRLEVDYRNDIPGHRMVDTYRHLFTDTKEAFTCWSTATGARANNYGCRIDYILADVQLVNSFLRTCDILPTVQGSDHCPVKAGFAVTVLPGDKYPSLCTKWMPEFSGRQQKLHSFFPKMYPAASPQDGQSADVKASVVQPKRLRLSDTIIPSTKSKVTIKGRNVQTGGQKTLTSFFTKKMKVDTTEVTEAGTSSAVLMSSTVDPLNGVLQSSSMEKTVSGCCGEILCLETSRTEAKDMPFSDLIVSPSPIQSSPSTVDSAMQWRNLLRGPEPAPLCSGHREPCILKTVRKAGPNSGRQFYMCAKPEGYKNDPGARCQYFKWIGRGKVAGSQVVAKSDLNKKLKK